jgi:hypothetical protein
MNVTVYGDFNSLLSYLASQRADWLVRTATAEIDLAGRGALPPGDEQHQGVGRRLRRAVTDGVADELRRRLFEARRAPARPAGLRERRASPMIHHRRNTPVPPSSAAAQVIDQPRTAGSIS